MKTLAIIHTTAGTITSLNQLAKQYLKDVNISNLLDDSILPEINRAKAFTEQVQKRFSNLVENAISAKADVLLSACSSIGPLLEEAGEKLDIPAIRIDEAMAEQACAYDSITIMATLESTLGPSTDLIERKAQSHGKSLSIDSLVITEAGKMLNDGDYDAYKKIIAEEIVKASETSSCIVLAQASMAAALDLVPEDKKTVPVLTSPVAGIQSLEPYFN